MRNSRPVNEDYKQPTKGSLSPTAPLLSGSDEPKSSYDSFETIPPTDDVACEQSGVQESVFDDPVLAHFYQPHYLYEGLHRFDPRAYWTKTEEENVVKKIDAKIMSWCCVMFIALQLDRGNISMCISIHLLRLSGDSNQRIEQAMTDNFLGDLGMNTNGT